MIESDVLDLLRAGNLSLPPIEFGDVRAVPEGPMDALLSARWNGKEWQFAVEIKARSTPKTLREAIQTIQAAASPPRTYPLVVVPYLSNAQVDELARERLSGVDLNGNGVLVVPGELLVLRTGRPNRYREKSVLKNVYRGKVSLAARVFLLRPRYAAVGEIRNEILARGGELALSTVSKVLARLEDDLIVSRRQGDIRLLQPETLLDALTKQYESPIATARLTGKTNLKTSVFARRLSEAAALAGIRFAPTGRASTLEYAVMATDEPVSFYCTEIKRLIESIDPTTSFEATERFPNVLLEETRDETVYFDVRADNGRKVASPLQTYLELATGDKRERQTAKQVAETILNAVRL